MGKGRIIRDENGYVVELVPTKKQLENFLKPLIPAVRELILKRRLEQKKLQKEGE
ncbi:hypothetical protein [Bacillus manliponensis]|uniref:hypothetical protein n=1 Tax=Bacillus manliponensis TaxID=574376 RepID=UPI000B11625C|nr:hypothetical protein [Bacillus manliponensis]